ncbi:MAG TPA: response regulator [Marinagarivorans sp.]
MGAFAGENLRFLVVEDSPFFRSAINGMLNSFGVTKVEVAQNGNQAMEACKSHHYDVVLCDYDLGKGKTGQQLLEALRHNKIIDRTTLFMMVTADTSRQAVMASSECSADDYLTKPINAVVLKRRVSRLLSLHKQFEPVFKALDEDDIELAIQYLELLAEPPARNAAYASKLLGEVLLQANHIDRAEAHYQKIIDDKPMEWVRLGLAFVAQARGDIDAANAAFNDITKDNPYCLAAYDGLAKNYHLQGDFSNLQKAIASAVRASPASILRQKNLANIAEQNGDIPTALDALRECVRLGYHSCYGDWHDAYRFGMNTADMPTVLLEEKEKLPDEALKMLKAATNYFDVSDDDLLRMQFLQGRLQYLARQHVIGEQSIFQAEALYCELEQGNVVTDIARVKAIRTLNDHKRANEITDELKLLYEDDQKALQKLDEVLDEPVSKKNRKVLAETNKKGIQLYNEQRYDEAIQCFQRAQVLFPRHIGIQLNICQAYIGKHNRGDAGDLDVVISDMLTALRDQIKPSDPQFNRFRKLQEMARFH